MNLAEALRQVAADVPSYDVVEGAIRAGRRRRWRTVVGGATATLAVLALTILIAIPVVVVRRPVTAPLPGPTIPLRVGPAGWFTPDASSDPAGPASVILSPTNGNLTVVGSAADSYRVVHTTAQAGRDAFLSPDGTRLAYTTSGGVAVADLVHGGTRTYPTATGADGSAPLAWFPAGDALVVLTFTYPDDPTTQGTDRQLSILDLASGVAGAPFAEATWPIASPGWTVAVSPDATRIAYEFSDFITVYDIASGAKIRWDLPSARYALAGPAAWAVDGSLTLIAKIPDDGGPVWRLELVDPATGALRTLLGPPLAGPGAVRLIGWAGGDPVLISYTGSVDALSGVGGDVLYGGFDGQVSVAAYPRSGSDAVRVLLREAGAASFIDLAATALVDPHTRPGDPPWRPSGRLVITVLLTLVLLGVVALAVGPELPLRRGRGRPGR